LAAHLKDTLPHYAIPLFIRITDAMKLTGNMKHQKHEMREQGVDHDKLAGETILWLRNDDYIRFNKDDWEGLKKGRVKL
jgi:acyl-CoA synthetase (AMP-forming)/AMP-acid ligase II